jgi:hypothetical protein
MKKRKIITKREIEFLSNSKIEQLCNKSRREWDRFLGNCYESSFVYFQICVYTHRHQASMCAWLAWLEQFVNFIIHTQTHYVKLQKVI